MKTWSYSLIGKHSLRRRHRPTPKHVSRDRRGAFETLEARLALTVDLGFAAAFEALGGSSNNLSSGILNSASTSMVTDANGNSYVTLNGGIDQGVDVDPGPAVNAVTLDAGLVKLDPSGALVWAAPLNATGGASPVVRILDAVDADQNVYLVGDFRGTVDFDPGPGVMNATSSQAGAEFSVYLSKLNSSGVLQWVHTLDGRGLSPSGLVLDGDGNLVISAPFSSGSGAVPMDVDPGPGEFLMEQIGSTDQLILKYSSDGDFIWARQLSGVGASVVTSSVAVDAQSEVFIAGGYSGSVDFDPGAGVHLVSNSDAALDGFVARLTPDGDFVWAYVTEGNGSAPFRNIEIAGDGSIVVGAHFKGTVDFQPGSGSLPLTSVGSYHNGLVIKLESDSSIAWARQYGSNGQTLARDADIDQEGNIYLGGNFGADGYSDFDPGPGVYELVIPSIHTVGYVLSLTPEGDFRWAAPLGGSGWTGVEGLSVMPNGTVHVAGAFRQTNDFDPNVAGEAWLSSGSVQSVFAATLNQSDPIPGAPAVDAGANQTILVTDTATLNGTVIDDGLPSPTTTMWSMYSGPGMVTFGNASAVDTTAKFSTSGGYWLQLKATDTQFDTTDYVYIVVNPVAVTLTATADTYIDGGKKTSNYGAASSLFMDGNPANGALLKWNLSSIAAGSSVQSAAMSVNVTGTSVDTYEIYELKKNWTELQATWNKASTGANWQSAGALGSLDRGSTVLGSVTASTTGVRNIVLNAAGLAVVQGWVNNPATNFGFILQDYANTTKDDLVFSSRETTVAANRPQLKLVYNPPSVAPLSLITVGAPASAMSSGEIFASKLIPTVSNNLSAAKRVDSGSLAATARQPQIASSLLVAAQLRQLQTAGADSVLADVGHRKVVSTSWDNRLDDDLIMELISAQFVRLDL